MEKVKGRASPMTIRVGGRVDMEYAVAASMTPGETDFGAACSNMLRCEETCRCESWSVPVKAMIKGMYSSSRLPWPSTEGSSFGAL